jgi:hypothetical protein
MVETWLKVQLEDVRRKMQNWPEWEKKELQAEIERTPLKTEQDGDEESRSKPSTSTS